jgi:hypothetical protein
MKWPHALLIAAALASAAQATPPADAPVSSVLTAPAHPETDPAALKAQVAGVLSRLASPAFKERQKAQADVADLPVEALGLITAASEDPSVDPEVRARLKEALPGYEKKSLAKAAEAEAARVRAWRRRLMLAEYQKAGQHNPAWDDKVRAAITSDTAGHTPGANEREEREHTRGLYQSAIDAGCQDPLVLYRCVALTAVATHDEGVARAARCLKAADLFDASDYPALEKMSCYLRAIDELSAYPRNDGQDAMLKQHYADLALAGWPDLIRTAGVPDEFLVALAGELRTKDPAYARVIGEHLLEDLRKQGLDSGRGGSAALKIIDARCQLAQYWKGGYNPDDAFLNDLRGHMETIRSLLEQAWAQNPVGSSAATTMVEVEWIEEIVHRALGDRAADWPAGVGSREAMETWFNRAIATNPDDWDACAYKLTYLEYFGDHPDQDMLAFGRQMFATGRWTGRVPLMLIEAHRALAKQSGSVPDYFAQPAVWAEVKMCYQELMKHDPVPGFDASWYLTYAAYAGDWQTAADLCRQIGDHPAPAVFGGLQAYKDLRTKVFQRAAITTAPG